jgi:hypothetical protein
MDIGKFWNKYGFEVMLVVAVLIILYFVISKKGRKEDKKGDYSFLYKNFKPEEKKEKRRWTGYKSVSDLSQSFSSSDEGEKENNGKESKGEAECRRVMEKIFKKPFTKIRPDWLHNPVTSKNLEIDIFNDELKIGVEYSGKQHYHFTPFFHKTKETFTMQQYRDEMKKGKCKERGILLIEVPYNVEIEMIEKFLIQELKKNGKI